MAPTSQMSGEYSAESSRKNLPQNIEAEKTVLAACLLNPEALEDLVVSLKPENFFRPAHRLIFESLIDMCSRSIGVDPISLAETLRAAGNLEASGGQPYLLELADNTYALTNWQTHADIVKRTSVLRELLYASSEITALAYDPPDNLDEVVDTAEKTLFSVTEKRVSNSFKKVDTLLEETFAEIQSIAEQKGHMAGVPTGFHDVDELFHGLRGGDLVILAARPGVGKTAFALNLAVNSAKAQVSTVFFSLEMSAIQLMQRILCTESNVPLNKVRGGYLNETDWGLIAGGLNRLNGLPLYIDDTPSLSILQLRAKARRELRNVEKGLIVVDYLQLLQPPQNRRDGNRNLEVGEISRGLKILAKEMDMPVIALSQLSRSIESRGKKRPMLSDLRESGSIEQDADIVMFIDRSMNEMEAEENGRPELGCADLIVEKHRNGPTRDIRLAYNAENTKYSDYIDASRL